MTSPDTELDDRTVRDIDTTVNTTPSPVTAKDAMGVERIITTTTGYDAPQVEPDPKEVARLKYAQEKLAGKTEERLAQLTSPTDGSAKVGADAIAAESPTSTSQSSGTTTKNTGTSSATSTKTTSSS